MKAERTVDPADLDPDRLALLELLGGEMLDNDAQEHPLSDAQRRLWFSDRAEGANVLFNFPSLLHFEALVDLGILKHAFQTVARRHLVLTSRIEEREGEPVQIFDPDFVVDVPVVDLSALPADRRQPMLERLCNSEANRIFDLSADPLFHIAQVRVADDRSYLLWNMHHIVSDGWSSAIFLRELLECFRAASAQEVPRMPDLDIQYSDFVYWQQERLGSPAIADSLLWWQQNLAKLPTLRLPLDRPRGQRRSTSGDLVAVTMTGERMAQLRALAQKRGCTLFSVLLACFKVVLARYHGETDIVVGTSVASRPLPDLESLIGLFVNQLVLRTELAGNPRFSELVERVSRTGMEALAQQEVPFDRVVAAVTHQRVPGVSPLFQVLFLLNNMPRQGLEDAVGPRVRATSIASKASRFDLSLTFDEADAGWVANWGFRTDIFDRGTIETMAGRFEVVLDQVLADPDGRIDEIETFTNRERQARVQDMEKKKEVRSSRFKGVQRRTVDLGALQFVRESTLEGTERSPLVFSPATTQVDLAEWAQTEREMIEQRLLRHGAILFRGFGVRTVDAFERFAKAICPELVGDYGDLPKESRGEKIYKSTPYPEDKAILFHNESSHTHRWPMKQFFSCIEVAREGGETPIVDCRELYRKLDPALAERFAEKGLLYQRNFIEGLDVSWQDFFKTHDRGAVEAHLDRLGTEFAWTDGGNLRVRQRARAVARHPKTGEWVFFNQIQLHHVDCMEPAERDSLRALFSEDDLPRNVYYGDGEPIAPEVIAQIDRLYASTAVSFPWESGDVLMVDNMLTAHGRYPFKGSRKVVVAMGEMINATDLVHALEPANG